jgi:hypothetical protein
VKVSQIFGKDVEALKLLSKIMKNQYVRNIRVIRALGEAVIGALLRHTFGLC